MHTAHSREVRDRLYKALYDELVGPAEINEAIREFPTSRYLAGRLAPARQNEHDVDAVVEQSENDSLAVGTAEGEEGSEDASPPLIIGFNPSSIGLSFLVHANANVVDATVSWGDYLHEKSDSGGFVWKRYHRAGTVRNIPVSKVGPLVPISLTSGQKPGGPSVFEINDAEIFLEGVVHDFAGYRAVSLFLVNRRSKGKLNDRSKDERWIFQPHLRVTTVDGKPGFVAKDSVTDMHVDPDSDSSVTALLYRHSREFATGHGIAANWEGFSTNGEMVTAVFSEIMPKHEVPLLIAPNEGTGGAILDMKLLSAATSQEAVVKMLQPMIDAYERWIRKTEEASKAPEISLNSELKDAAEVNLRLCRECAQRIKSGLSLLATSLDAFKAFQFANGVMWDQRIHALWSSTNRKNGSVKGSPIDFDIADNRTWRPFQMGFILLNLVGITDEKTEDRQLVDLLWFPTGGGKTEAYLGLAAFTLALRRLRKTRFGLNGSAGVSIIMRYTLRLLTVQQFQRAAALICACELLRKRDEAIWGNEPFRIGIWVGRGTTPNTFHDSQKALDDIRDGKKPKSGSPVQVVACPRCGTSLVTDKGIPLPSTYMLDSSRQRTLTFCPNAACDFSVQHSQNSGLPVVVVDDEIYRTCPCFIVSTVDKFARLPFKGEARALFGLVDRKSTTYGWLTEATGSQVGGRRVRDAVSTSRLLPPELIIQDELHLISGPLGTMVGLYETAVSYASSITLPNGDPIPPKIIASTATIRRAAQQTHQLYGGRKLAIFPAAGITARDSFFAREREIDPEADSTAGRLYVGVNTPGSSAKTLLVRVYSILLAAAEAELAASQTAADPYGTLVGYFNSLRALGGAKRLVEDDVKLIRLKYLHRQRGFPRRWIDDPVELTSRIDSWKIPPLLKKLDYSFPRGTSDWPVDVLLATNMISVGVDIDRLGLMVVTGQPKSTSEYIQATSRVGRKYPGLVVTMYNWMGARDLSHYERFQSYHAALYRYVEAISVTPFSSRALDRGLRGVFATMNRLTGSQMAGDLDAHNFDPASTTATDIIEEICKRATAAVGSDNAQLVRARLESYRDEWAHLADSLLRYAWLDDSRFPPNNSRVLLRTAGTDNEGRWPTPGSLREVEPTAGFFLHEDDQVRT